MEGVAVLSVTVSCVVDGKVVELRMDPRQVSSIFLNQEDFNNAKEAISKSQRNVAFSSLRQDPAGHGVAEVRQLDDSVTESLLDQPLTRELWWHTSGCEFIHPQDDALA